MLALALACGAPALGPVAVEQEATAEVEPLSAAALEQHVRFLASDELGGRMTGSPGALEAAEYQAEVLRAAGVEPGGDGGTYLQTVPLQRLVYDQLPRLTVLFKDGAALPLVYGADFYGLAGPVPDGRLELASVRSKADVPSELGAGVALFLDGNVRERNEWLEGAGDFGLELRPGSSRSGPVRTDAPRGAYWVAGEDAPRAAISIRGPLLERFRSGEVESLVVTSGARVESLEAANVVGILPGVGERARETVVFSAHYDHIGTREPPPEQAAEASEASEAVDTVFNGADDDASGCAAVLELARAFGAGERPERTLVFLLATGEEIGLLGTEHYLQHPLRPLADTVCNLNFEMIGRADELVGGPGRVWLSGDERSNLGAAWRAAGIEVTADPRPEQSFFTRSDNYAFAVLGIVAQTLSTYNLHGDYHAVTDEADTLDYAHMQAVVQTSYRAARMLADGSLTPAWNPGGDPSQR